MHPVCGHVSNSSIKAAAGREIALIDRNTASGLLSIVHPCIVIQPLYLIQCGSSEEEEKLLTYRQSSTTIHSRTLTLQICISLRWVSALILKYVNDKGVSKQLSALIWLNSAHSHIMRQHHCDFWQLWINSRLLTNVKSADSKTTRGPY